jgi:16S rRNA (uracil1498-N3)-methyltransferase
MQLFYNAKVDNSATQFSFPEEESRHIVRVLRKQVGDELQITNGKGYIFTAKIIDANEKRCKIEVVSKVKKHQKMHWLHMVVAPTKSNERYEWFLEKATEIGVNEITPIICANSERKTLKMERLKKVLLSAMKQSNRSYLPKLNDLITFDEFLNKEHKGLRFIAHCKDDEKMDLKRRVAADKDVIILIGPEGDFTKQEINRSYELGFLPVSLNEGRLRTETAAIIACATVAMINSG